MIFENNVEITEKAIYSKQCKNPVYIVLMHTGTPLASAIKKITGDQFSHACISFNSKLDPLYSFGSKGDNHKGTGFSVTNPKDSFFARYNSFYHVYVMYVSDDALKAMTDRLEYFENNANKLKYDFLGLFDILRNKSSEHHEAWFCSRFVMELIQKVDTLSKVPSLWKPSDISNLDNISLVNKGYDFYNYNYKITDKHCDLIKKKKYKSSDVVYEGISSNVEKDYESKQSLQLSSFHRMTLNDIVIRVHSKQYPQLSHVRINRSTKGYVWIDNNQQLVGLINTQEKDDDYKWIISFEVFGKYKGQGLSRQILNVAVKQLGVTHLSVNRSNQVAIKLYKSYGFRKYKETDTMYFMTISKYSDVNEACKDIDTARRFVRDVGKLAKKYNANYFIVTDGASGTSNGNGGISNPAVRNAREAQIKWERENGFYPDEDWEKDKK